MNKQSLIAVLAAAACLAGTGSALAQPTGGASATKGTTPKKCKVMNENGTGPKTLKPGQKSTTRWPDGSRTNWYCRQSGTTCYYHYENGTKTQHCYGARVAPQSQTAPTVPATAGTAQSTG